MPDIMEIIKLVQQSGQTEAEQLEALAAMAEPPGEDFQAEIMLPVQNELPAFKVGDKSLGSLLAGLDYGVAAPVIGQESSVASGIGELLVGDIDAS